MLRGSRIHPARVPQGAARSSVCTKGRECLFGRIVDGCMQPNAFGEIVHEEWRRAGELRREIRLDAFVVMPNHIHGIVIICPVGETNRTSVGATGRSPLRARRPPRGPARHSLGSFVGRLKPEVTKRVNQLRGTPGAPVWQRNYYEHVVRNEEELSRIREYIVTNPLRWAFDRENPAATTRAIRESLPQCDTLDDIFGATSSEADGMGDS